MLQVRLYGRLTKKREQRQYDEVNWYGIVSTDDNEEFKHDTQNISAYAGGRRRKE